MSAQFLFSANATDQFDVVSDEAEVTDDSEEFLDSSSKTKQREALYYIVAVITFYALTFLVLFCKYARFKKKEFEDSYPYFPLPPDPKVKDADDDAGDVDDDELLDMPKGGSGDGMYGSTGVTPKVMRVKLLQHWMCRGDRAKACDV
nr:hypothetical protein BaRGS_010709 [Batillaria attramentaria]